MKSRRQLKPAPSNLQRYLNMREAAEYLGMSYSDVCAKWPDWDVYGCIPARRPGGRNLMFDRKELDRMVEQWKVTQPQGGNRWHTFKGTRSVRRTAVSAVR